eukprot:TRINITY_DN18113_c1_g1_i1.p1 TRINITY_DN18113_c1_g1~~TRINITY_DN18113_c1_g1_i1.p1  ORF type:complete len:379 (-),score=70.70 TRINITY_DN18113_c1_g1_i1:138-1136(-)
MEDGQAGMPRKRLIPQNEDEQANKCRKVEFQVPKAAQIKTTLSRPSAASGPEKNRNGVVNSLAVAFGNDGERGDVSKGAIQIGRAAAVALAAATTTTTTPRFRRNGNRHDSGIGNGVSTCDGFGGCGGTSRFTAASLSTFLSRKRRKVVLAPRRSPKRCQMRSMPPPSSYRYSRLCSASLPPRPKESRTSKVSAAVARAAAATAVAAAAARGTTFSAIRTHGFCSGADSRKDFVHQQLTKKSQEVEELRWKLRTVIASKKAAERQQHVRTQPLSSVFMAAKNKGVPPSILRVTLLRAVEKHGKRLEKEKRRLAELIARRDSRARQRATNCAM